MTRLSNSLSLIEQDWGRGFGFGIGEGQLVVDQIDADFAAFGQLAEQHFVGKDARDLVFDEAAERARAEAMVVAVLPEPFLRCGRNFKCYFIYGEALVQLAQEL